MENITISNRRRFLQISAAGAAGAMATGLMPRKIEAKTGGWSDGLEINPEIDNLRVVFAQNTAMNPQQRVSSDFATQNSYVDGDEIAATLDKMAVALAQKPDAGSAWSTIFRKPDSKNWGDVLAAIKVNALGNCHALLPVVNKMCDVLKGLGVAEGNITVYDNVRSATGIYNRYIGNGLPSGIQVSDRLNVDERDILVNIANNKSHGTDYGSTTLTMKNHFGTLQPSHNYNTLISHNKSTTVIGNPGLGIPPRQQLAILDSVFAATSGGAGGNADKTPCYLVMGTLPAAIDFLSVRKIREEEMGASHSTNVNQFLPSFGYSPSDRDGLLDRTPEENNGRGWVDAMSYEPPTRTGQATGRGRHSPAYLAVACESDRIKMTSATRVELVGRDGIRSISVLDTSGRMVRSLDPGLLRWGVMRIVWNGRDDSGRLVAAGTYVVSVRQKNTVTSARLTVAA
jgi:hypothetical protein